MTPHPHSDSCQTRANVENRGMTDYFRPIAQVGSPRPAQAMPIAGGWAWFTEVEVLRRSGASQRISASDLTPETRAAICDPRAAIAGVPMDRPSLMGILNVTPDSFSDGGQFDQLDAAVARCQQMLAEGADILDIGGESTRPGADEIPVPVEIDRTAPVIAALRAAKVDTPLSIDTRKSVVADTALKAGASIVNDVAAFTYDPLLAGVTALHRAPVCLMHAQGDPQTMQHDPQYDDVLLDVFDFLADRVQVAVAAGIPKSDIIVDPGIGFGKTLDHNLDLLRGISLFHGLGCPVLLGASRKRFIGTLANAPEARDRVPGSMIVAMEAARQGIQILRVHDVKETKQAFALSAALWGTDRHG